MNKIRTYAFSLLLTALMVTACTLEGDIDAVLEKAGIENSNSPNNPTNNLLITPEYVEAWPESSSSIVISWEYDIYNGGWDYPYGWPDYFEVYRSSSVSGSYKKTGTVYANSITRGGNFYSYTDTGLSANKTYYYKVSACYKYYGKSPLSSSVSATTLSSSSSGTLATPSGVKAEALSSSGYIVMSWNPVSGADGYLVFRSYNASGPYDPVGGTEDTEFWDFDVSPNTTYYYKVSAFDSYTDRVSPQSSYVSATTPSHVY